MDSTLIPSTLIPVSNVPKISDIISPTISKDSFGVFISIKTSSTDDSLEELYGNGSEFNSVRGTFVSVKTSMIDD